MTRRRATVVTAAITAALALLLAACGDGIDLDAPVSPTAEDGDEVADDAADDGSPTDGGDDQAEDQDGVPGTGELRGCERLDEADDGVYVVAQAGELTMRRDGDRLVLEEVRPAPGWSVEEVDRDDDEVEVDFRRGEQEIEFEAELDDGVLEIEICADS